MRRRAVISLLGGASSSLLWPLAARAQPSTIPLIGFLHSGSPEANAKYVAGFRKGLVETGHVEGRNLVIEYRWGHGEDARLPELAAGGVDRPASERRRDPRRRGGGAWLPRPRPRQFRSCSSPAPTRCRPASSPASIG